MDNGQDAQMEQAQREIEKLFQNIQNDIPVFLFAQPGINDVFSDAARQGLRFFRQLTDKITLKEYNLSHEQAQKWQVHSSPTLVLAPDTYQIKWLGAPRPWAKRAGYFSRHFS